MADGKHIRDEDLMRAYCLGDEAAFAELYRRHSGRVYAYIRKRVAAVSEAEEVFQAIFLKAHRSRHRYDFKFSFAQWIYVIAKTVLLDHFRKQSRSVKTEELGSEVSQTEVAPPLYEEEELAILDVLSPDQRAVVEMRVIQELSYGEIAWKLSKTQEGVRQTLSRAMKRLRLERKEGGSE